MDGEMSVVLKGIVAEFGGWVKILAGQIDTLANEADVQRLEIQLRDGGRQIMLKLMQQLMQEALDRKKQQARQCPNCRWEKRRHQGVRSRRLLSNFGSLTLSGIYWRCPVCGHCSHAADALAAEPLSSLMKGLVCLLGVSLASFDKAELVAERVLGVKVDDETIRRLCLREGWGVLRQEDSPPVPVADGGELIGSCDGTMLHTRETGWREVKSYRFEHAAGKYGGAYLEKVDDFVPRLAETAQRLGARKAGRCLFLSDMAEWIRLAVAERLPDWKHIADYWHACQHVYKAGEELYGKENPQARAWSRYWSKRLRRYGGGVLAEKLAMLCLYYKELSDQEVVLKLVRFFRKHADETNYPAYERQGWTISSGPMESFCKQIGLRMKGPGMHWSVKNVSPMAMLVSRWSLDGQHNSLFGAVPTAA